MKEKNSDSLKVLGSVVRLVILEFTLTMFLFACLSGLLVVVRKDQEVLGWIGSDGNGEFSVVLDCVHD